MSNGCFVRRFVNLLKEEEMFFYREVGVYGTRNSVDFALNELIKKEQVVRIVRGVFMKGDNATPRPPIIDVVMAKARSNGWNVHLDDLNASKLIHNSKAYKNAQQEITIFITGNSTSFKYENTTITVTALSPRKLQQMKEKGLIKEAVYYLASRSGSSASKRSANFFNRLKE
jgi:hypothetical protein